MYCVKDNRLNDFLWENGLRPVWERNGISYYHTGKPLNDLLLRYTVIYELIPNKIW